MTEPAGRRNGAIEQALSYTVYAPLGFALEARSLLPRFIDRGRSQILLARVIGKYAVRQGTAAAEAAALRAQEQGLALLRLVGLAPTPGPETAPATGTEGDGHPPPADGTQGSAQAPPEPPPVDPASLAIPDYDSLSASQVVPRLEGLTADELEQVRAYEAGTRGRKTILNKIAQLQSA